MGTIAIADAIGQLPASEVTASMKDFLGPLIDAMPDRRLDRVVPLAVQAATGSRLRKCQSVPRPPARPRAG
jgi:hypothetical protein